MNNKLLLGSIISVVILILVSFTSVVGYDSVKSNVKASPLFNMRINRAIETDSKDLNCDYIGKGEENDLSIPKRDSRIESIQKIIEVMKRIDDITFNKFVKLCVYEANNHHKFKRINNNVIIDALYQIKDKPEVLMNAFIDENEDKRLYTKSVSMFNCCTFPMGGCDTLDIWNKECFWDTVVIGIVLLGLGIILSPLLIGALIFRIIEVLMN